MRTMCEKAPSTIVVPVFVAFTWHHKRQILTFNLLCGFLIDMQRLLISFTFPASVHTSETEKQRLLDLHHAIRSIVSVQSGGDNLPLILPPQFLGFYPICLWVHVSIIY